MKMKNASKPMDFRSAGKKGFQFKMKRTFGDGGMSMMPPGGAPPADPAAAIAGKVAAVPPAQRAKVKAGIKKMLQSQLAAKQAPSAPAPIGPPPGPPMMKGGGTVKKAIGGSVRGVGIARKGGGRGKIV